MYEMEHLVVVCVYRQPKNSEVKMRIRPLLASALLATSFMAVAAPQASAQSQWSDDYYRQAAPMSRQVVLCRKMCPQDFSPCDPIYFKTADGRCSGIPNR